MVQDDGIHVTHWLGGEGQPGCEVSHLECAVRVQGELRACLRRIADLARGRQHDGAVHAAPYLWYETLGEIARLAETAAPRGEALDGH